MKNIIIFPALSRVRSYQLKCSFLLTSVPLICCSVLVALLFFFAQQNLYFLENGGLIINEHVRQAYHDQIQIELLDVLWYIGALFVLTFAIAYLMMGWAISPFVNAEKVLRSALADNNAAQEEGDWLSESPTFHKVIWGLTQRLKDKSHVYDNFGPPRYKFNFRFFLKFVCGFYAVSMATGYILGIIFNTVYLKIVSLAITLVRMTHKGHYFMAQEELLRVGVTFMVILSCIVYAVIGYYVTRYMSNMIFVFVRAVKEHHFPLRLRDSDVYHGLAHTISDVAEKGGLK